MKVNEKALVYTKETINQMSSEDASNFVREIIGQLNEKHGDSYDKGGFEFATLFFP